LHLEVGRPPTFADPLHVRLRQILRAGGQDARFAERRPSCGPVSPEPHHHLGKELVDGRLDPPGLGAEPGRVEQPAGGEHFVEPLLIQDPLARAGRLDPGTITS